MLVSHFLLTIRIFTDANLYPYYFSRFLEFSPELFGPGKVHNFLNFDQTSNCGIAALSFAVTGTRANAETIRKDFRGFLEYYVSEYNKGARGTYYSWWCM